MGARVRWFLLGFRLFLLLAHAVWVGGFMFYSVVVIGVLHDLLTSLDAGGIRREVTVWLNVIGLVALGLWAAMAWLERRDRPRWAVLSRAGLIGLSALILAALVLLHRSMSWRLEEGLLRGFYPWHRAYLIASTAQWAANVGILGATLVLWTSSRVREGQVEGEEGS